MTDETMTLETFEACISAYGADPDAWPQAERAALQQFAADNPQAAALLARERALDGLLAARLPQPPETLQAAVLAGMHAAMDAAPDAHQADTNRGDSVALPAAAPTRTAVALALTAMAACFIGGFVMAPVIFDTMTAGSDLLASLDIISDTFLPSEPL